MTAGGDQQRKWAFFSEQKTGVKGEEEKNGKDLWSAFVFNVHLSYQILVLGGRSASLSLCETREVKN